MYSPSTAFALALALTATVTTASILPSGIPERDVSSMCSASLCSKGTFCRVITACVSLGCFPHATCLPCVPEGVDAICNANNYLYTVLMVKPYQERSTMSRFTPQMCNPTLNNDESGCFKGSVCIASEQSKELGTCCFGKPDPENAFSTSASNNDPICDEPSDLCGEKCPKGTTCLPTSTECGKLSYSCRPEHKTGTCPPIPFGNPGMCAKIRAPRFCGDDSDCKGDKKCCKTVCGGSACFSPL